MISAYNLVVESSLTTVCNMLGQNPEKKYLLTIVEILGSRDGSRSSGASHVTKQRSLAKSRGKNSRIFSSQSVLCIVLKFLLIYYQSFTDKKFFLKHPQHLFVKLHSIKQ